MARLLFASLVTFGIGSGMVIGCVLAAMLFMGEVNLMLAIVLTVVLNLLIWLISPWLSDFGRNSWRIRRPSGVIPACIS